MAKNKAGQTMSDEHNSSKDRYNPQTEKLLKQFLSLESVNANSAGFRAAYDDAFNPPLEIQPKKCLECEFVATTSAESRHHVRMTRHSFEPDNGITIEGCDASCGGAHCDQVAGHEGLHTAGPGKSWGL